MLLRWAHRIDCGDGEGSCQRGVGPRDQEGGQAGGAGIAGTLHGSVIIHNGMTCTCTIIGKLPCPPMLRNNV
jgi:hypothetical protein